MNGTSLTPADIYAMTRSNDHEDAFGENWIWIIGLLIIAGIFGGGNGWFGNGNGNNNLQGALTRSDMFEGFNNQDVNAQLRGITNGLCDGFYAQNTNLLNGFNGIQRDLCTGFNGVNANINQARFDMQQCCCETNRNIDNVRYENARNTCDIVNAIKADGDATRALITQNTIQDLRDRLQEEKLANSQCAQNAYLVNTLRPCPVPAYATCNPWATNYNSCGCGNSLY